MSGDRLSWNRRTTPGDPELLVEHAWQSVSAEQLEEFHRLFDAAPAPNERLRRTMAAPRPWEV